MEETFTREGIEDPFNIIHYHQYDILGWIVI